MAARNGLRGRIPETAYELRYVAQTLDSSPAQVHLGAEATKANVKRLSVDGTLAKYKVVHFATHGTLAGQFSPGAEPRLLMTPPARANENEYG